MTQFIEKQDHVITSGEVRSWAIQRRDWTRIRTNVEKLQSQAARLELVGWALLGIGASAVLALLALLTATDVHNWVWIASWVMCVAPCIGGLTVLIWLVPRDQSALATAKQSILGDMDAITTDLEQVKEQAS